MGLNFLKKQMDRIFWQEEIERKFNRKHIDKRIRQEILANPETVLRIEQGVSLLNEYIGKTYSYQSKNDRITQLKGIDLEQLTIDIFTAVAYHQKEELFTSVTAQLAGRLGWSDKKEAIQTIAEIVAVLCMTDAFDIFKQGKMGSLMLVSRIPLSQETVEYIENSQYLPPMICRPRKLMSNYDSGYLTHKESLVLGSGNHHEGDLCLDVLNIMNGVELKLDTEFLSKVEEEPTFDLDTPDKIENWKNFKRQSYRFYSLIAQHGNHFYLTHKVDKRGRIYASGYHISTQGTSFKKASIELAKEEFVEVPEQYRR